MINEDERFSVRKKLEEIKRLSRIQIVVNTTDEDESEEPCLELKSGYVCKDDEEMER